MSEIELTRQQLDPVGALSARLLAIVLAVGSFSYGVAMTVRAQDQVVNPLLAVLALVWLGGAALTLAVASSPLRAPFTASAHTVVQLLALGAIALSVASQWGSNRYIQDDFGPISLGLLMMGMGVYRPARELASAGIMSAIFVGFITLLEVPSLVSTAPPVTFVLVAMTPILALSFASASYSGGLVAALEKWGQEALRSAARTTTQLTGGITRAVRQDRVTVLDRDVFPFFESVVSSRLVTDADRLRARTIADSLRTLMVAEADRTWLENISGDGGAPFDLVHHSVTDPDGRAVRMVGGQRTVLRALVMALRDDPKLMPGSVKFTITGKKSQSHGVLSATIGGGGDDPRETYAPYFAVMRIVFSELNVEYRHNILKVRFTYDQR